MDSLSIPLSPYLSPLPTILCVTQNRDHEVQVHADDLIMFLQLAGQEDGQVENKYELSLMTAHTGQQQRREEGSREDTDPAEQGKGSREGEED